MNPKFKNRFFVYYCMGLPYASAVSAEGDADDLAAASYELQGVDTFDPYPPTDLPALAVSGMLQQFAGGNVFAGNNPLAPGNDGGRKLYSAAAVNPGYGICFGNCVADDGSQENDAYNIFFSGLDDYYGKDTASDNVLIVSVSDVIHGAEQQLHEVNIERMYTTEAQDSPEPVHYPGFTYELILVSVVLMMSFIVVWYINRT